MTPEPMTTAVHPSDTQRVARPLDVLAPLIQDDLKHAWEAAAQAAMPYYIAAGEKLREAKSQLPHGEFTAWIRRHCRVTPRHARTYMALADSTKGENGSALPFSSLRDFQRRTGGLKSWERRVSELMNLFGPDAEIRERQRRLALEVIDAGYKALSKKLHPDHGGSTEAMKDLNAVRGRLSARLKSRS